MDTIDIEQLQRSFDQAMSDSFYKYRQLHEQLDTFAGRDLQRDERIQVENIMNDIQNVMAEMYPGLQLIVHRHQWAVNIINTHNQWLDHLQRQGIAQIPDKHENA